MTLEDMKAKAAELIADDMPIPADAADELRDAGVVFYMFGYGFPGCLYDYTCGPFETFTDAALWGIDTYITASVDPDVSGRVAFDNGTIHDVRAGDVVETHGRAIVALLVTDGRAYGEVFELDY